MNGRAIFWVAPVALIAAGLMGTTMSLPPWFNEVWGEERSVDWMGIIISVPQVFVGAAMLARIPGAYVVGVGLAVYGALLNSLVLTAVSGAFYPERVLFFMALGLYLLVILGAVTQFWSGRNREPQPTYLGILP